MCTLQRIQPISLLILGSVFSDCVAFMGYHFHFVKNKKKFDLYVRR